MEKFIHRISFIISAALVYLFGMYTYLSYKGFVYEDGGFYLIKDAQAGFFDNFLSSEDSADAVPAPFSEPVKDNVALNLPQEFMIGNPDAPISIYEFSSLGCTHCADFHLNMLPKLKKNYIDTGKIKLSFIHFPLDKRSMQAALLSECFEGKQKTDIINLLFSKQREWSLATDPMPHFVNYAVKNGLKQEQVSKCLKNDVTAKEVLFHRQEAIDKLGIKGTPALLITSGDKREIIAGVSSIHELKDYLDKFSDQDTDTAEE